MNHTPGPWKWSEGESPCHQELHRTEFEPGQADSVCYHGADWSMEKSDMVLIAVAPELLEAAKALLNRIDNITTHDFQLGGERTEREALRTIITRIESAT